MHYTTHTHLPHLTLMYECMSEFTCNVAVTDIMLYCLLLQYCTRVCVCVCAGGVALGTNNYYRNISTRLDTTVYSTILYIIHVCTCVCVRSMSIVVFIVTWITCTCSDE